MVSGKKVSDDSKAQQYLHQGINQADFSRKFMLAEHVEVTDAQMEQGLLTINLHREVPATQQPRKISIGQAA